MRISLNASARINSVDCTKFTGTSGLYAAAIPDNKSVMALLKLFADCPVTMNDLGDYPHVTLIYSQDKAPANTDFTAKLPKTKLLATTDHLEFWEGHDKAGYVVLKLQSPALAAVNKYLCKFATHSFPDYVPHLTVAHNLADSSKLQRWIEATNRRLRSEYQIAFTCITIEDIEP